MTLITAHQPRCATCGYRRMFDESSACPECGSTDAPLDPLTHREVMQAFWLLLRESAPVWLLMPVTAAFGALAIAVDSVGLFATAAMLFVFAAFAITPMAALILAVAWTTRTLHAWWSLRDGEVGPWSGFGRRAFAFMAFLMFELFGSTLGAALGWLIFPGYPSGWQ